MEFYLDDCADSDRLISFLQHAGHSVRTPRSDHLVGVVDPIHQVHAAAQGCALITKNPKDFGDLHHEWQAQGRSHHGILLLCQDNVRGKDPESADIVRAIGNLLASGLPIANELHILNHWR